MTKREDVVIIDKDDENGFDALSWCIKNPMKEIIFKNGSNISVLRFRKTKKQKLFEIRFVNEGYDENSCDALNIGDVYDILNWKDIKILK
ncbi:MAG: hypothetical protein BV456_00915 [Thermoplasmata archaeon M8B2D]|nr:MAG: hypothetical protein BV456_00915 [Thermoplasmata archaeon M8B2D]